MLIFALQPVALGSWLPMIPQVQLALGLGPAKLALALLGMPAGTLVTLLFAGRLASALGARATIICGFIVYLLAMPLPAWTSGVTALFLTLALAGGAMSILELGMNLKADEIEKTGGRLIMSTCHGFWSAGIMLGSLIGSAFAAYGVPANLAVTVTAAAIAPLALLTAKGLPLQRSIEGPAAADRAKASRYPGRTLLGISIFTFGITMTEGAMADWSAIYLRDIFAAAGGTGGMGYAVFAAMVAVGRFGGDVLKARFGAVKTAQSCGLSALAGLLIIVAAPVAALAFFGFALTGFGVSAAFPLAVTAAAQLNDRPSASSVAILSFVALSGFLIGPPIIGFAAEHSNMRIGLAMLLPALALSFLHIGYLRKTN
jgi:MFS family permease